MRWPRRESSVSAWGRRRTTALVSADVAQRLRSGRIAALPSGARCRSRRRSRGRAALTLAAVRTPIESAGGWREVLDEHDGIGESIRTDAAWARAVADYSAAGGRPVRLVTLTEATFSGGRSRAQAAAQLARSAHTATSDRVDAFAISVETADERERRPDRRAGRPTSCAVRRSPPCPAPSWWRHPGGSGCGVTRVRPPPSHSGGRQYPGGSTSAMRSVVASGMS